MPKVNETWRMPVVRLVVGFVLVLLAVGTGADELNMTPGVTEISRSIYDLHMLIFWICVAIGVVVFGAMFWSLVHHRKSAGHQAAQFHESTRLEIAWTLVPALILVAIAFPATETLVAMYDTGGEDMTVEVRAYQWKWQYKYLDDDYNSTFGFFSNIATSKDEINNRSEKGEFYLLDVDEPLRIPVNRKVRFLITSEDVIHAWWVPDFGIKRDAIPGILNELWTIVPEEEGIYRGQCTELCGKDHGFMPIVVAGGKRKSEYDSLVCATSAWTLNTPSIRSTGQQDVFRGRVDARKANRPMDTTFCSILPPCPDGKGCATGVPGPGMAERSPPARLGRTHLDMVY